MVEVGSRNIDVINAAERAVKQARHRPESNLDFSPESLQIVEDLLAEAAKFASQLTAADLDQLSQAFGCYILEVGRREFGGTYFWHDQYKSPGLAVGEPECHVAMVTWPKVALRLTGGPADNIPFFYEGFAGRAKARRSGDRVLFV